MDYGDGPRGTKIPVGIHIGTITFDGIVPDPTWGADIKFSEPATGKSIYKRLFTPTGSKPQIDKGETVQQAKDREIARNLSHVTQLLQAFLGTEFAAEFGASSYDAYLASAIAVLSPFKGSKVNLKVVPDRTGAYPDLPSYGTYVEKHIPGEESKLKFKPAEQESIIKAEGESRKGTGSMSEEVGSLI